MEPVRELIVSQDYGNVTCNQLIRPSLYDRFQILHTTAELPLTLDLPYTHIAASAYTREILNI
jgi:hypothetical protein